jgi:hypothetical protein
MPTFEQYLVFVFRNGLFCQGSNFLCVQNPAINTNIVDQSGEEIVSFESFTDKRARNAEKLKQPSLCLRFLSRLFDFEPFIVA